MWIGVTVAVALIAYFAYGMAVADMLPRDIGRHLADPGKLEMWLIRAVATLAIIVGIATFFLGDPDGFLGGLWPELVGLGITVLFIDELNRGRSQRQYKQQIIRQMASLSNDFALDAARIAKDEGWLWDGSLKAANLLGADLQGVVLIKAVLHGADFRIAKLQNASFMSAELQDANFMGAYLQGANFWYANLDNANLKSAIYSKKTRWPENFDPETAGAILVD